MSKTEYNITWNNQKLLIRWRRITLRLAVAPWVCHGSETDPAAEVLDVLHEGVACELRAVVGDDSVRNTKMADQPLEELDS